MNQHPLAALFHIDAGRFRKRRIDLAVRSPPEPREIVGQDGGVAVDLPSVRISEYIASS